MNRPETLASADSLTPEGAVERLIALHDEAVEALRQALERFFSRGVPPSSKERSRFRNVDSERQASFAVSWSHA